MTGTHGIIENIRFNGELSFHFEKDPALFLEDIRLPSMILQPFLENAIWHGLPLASEKKIRLLVEKSGKKEVSIHIEDSGIGRRRSKEINLQKLHKAPSVGIKMTRGRLNILYESHSGSFSLNFEDLVHPNGEPAGTKLCLVLPLE